MQPVTDPELLAILNGSTPASGGPVYGPPPKAPAPPSPIELERLDIARRADARAQEAHDAKMGGTPEAEQATAEEQLARITTALDNLETLSSMVGSSDMGTGSIVGQESFRAGDDFYGASSLFNQRANDVAGSIEMVQGDLINQIRREMQESGAPIGVKGADTEKEAQRLAASIANLAQTQDEEQFLVGVGRARDYYLRRLIAAGGDPSRIELPSGPKSEGQVLVGYGRNEDGSFYPMYGEGGGGTSGGSAPPPAGGDSAPPPAGPSGGRFLGQLGEAGQTALDVTQNTLAGLAQGAAAGVYDFPLQVGNTVERGVNYALGEGGGALMDMVGLPGAADWWRQGANANEAQLAGPTSLASLASVSPAIERLSPTPEGMGGARLVTQFIGGSMVPFGPKAAPRITAPATAARAAPNAAREVIDAGRQNNVRVMTSDVRPPTTFTGKVARATGERIPYAGTGGPRAAQQTERVEAVRELARETGADVGAELLDEVAEDFATTRGGQVSGLTRAKNAVIDSIPAPLAPANVARTLEAIDAQTRRLASIDAEAFAPVIDRLTRFGANIASGKTLREIEGNRKLLGDMFEDASLAAIKGDGQKALNAIYGPLRDDMAAFIESNAGPAARSTWASANRQLSSLMGELDDKVFAGALRSADTTPENVARLLFSKKPSEVRRLVSNLSPAGRQKAQAAIIERAVETATDASGALSPDRFANEVGRLGNSIGVVFEGADLARVKGLERLLQATKQAGVASAAPPTGVQNSQLLMVGGVGASGGTGAIPLAIYGGLARLYESAPVRNLLVGLGKTTPGSKGESQMLQRILNIATSQTQIRGSAANDVLAASPSRVAAGEQENN
jgi:hypothetical protein